MWVDLNDWLGQYVYLSGEYEPATSVLFRRLLRPGDTVLDIGANAGYYSLLAARLVGAAGHVFAFEPLPRTRQLLQSNTRLNHFRNVTIREEALSDENGFATFFQAPDDHTGKSSLLPVTSYATTRRVATARLDDLLPAQSVTLVKIDVEGVECRVLDGMTKCLSRCRPDLIVEVVEEYLRFSGESRLSLYSRLSQYGYRMYMIGDSCLVPLDEEPVELPETFNALFTVNSTLPELPAAPAQRASSVTSDNKEKCNVHL
jgi:FkbM family methyltransferase